jgi:hypothetical protein
MNKRLEKYNDERLVEKRDWYWASTGFRLEVWDQEEGIEKREGL